MLAFSVFLSLLLLVFLLVVLYYRYTLIVTIIPNNCKDHVDVCVMYSIAWICNDSWTISLVALQASTLGYRAVETN